MRRGSNLDSLVAMILEMILYVKLRRLIGLKSENVAGDWVLGRRVKKKAFVARRSLPEEKKCETARITSLPTMCQQLVKKAPEKPSGPGELSLFRPKTSSLISEGDGIADREMLSSSVTEGPAISKRIASEVELGGVEEFKSLEK